MWGFILIILIFLTLTTKELGLMVRDQRRYLGIDYNRERELGVQQVRVIKYSCVGGQQGSRDDGRVF